MPRAIRSMPLHASSSSKGLLTNPPCLAGVLIECDPSIKSIIVNIDSENHDFIIEDLDEERVVVKENMVPLLKQKLEDRLKENLPPVDESGSE
ncbi:DNA repair protein Rex1 [Akanthomyces lecanii RCEF 1005]|uniref:General transcription and DNA repair factor IIH subunit TFB5 n=1 Tax=Akanthomyces lecanii RCEF 1005 TaxID=1081108 RepID=A0A168IX76_CORDF|nr:DNA repair protein Rex1 [Akanthomyces lecanii RCEF 1005]